MTNTEMSPRLGTGGQEEGLDRGVGGDLERAVRGGGTCAKSSKANGLCHAETKWSWGT